MYRGSSLNRKRFVAGPYGTDVFRALWWSWGGVGALPYERSTLVFH